MTKVTETISHVLVILGCHIPGKSEIRFIIFTILAFGMVLQSLVFLIMTWGTVPTYKFLAFEDATVLTHISGMFADLLFFPKKYQTLIDIIDRKPFKLLVDLSDKQKDTIKLFESNYTKTMILMSSFVLSYTLFNVLIPMGSGIFLLFSGHFDPNSEENLPLVFECWYPFKINTFSTYIPFAMYQLMFGTLEGVIFMCWIVLTMCGYLATEMELEILCQTVREIGTRLCYNTSSSSSTKEIERSMKEYIKKLVMHHQTILSYIKELNISTGFLVFMFNQNVCCQICMDLFASFQLKDQSLRIKYRLVPFPIIACFFIFCKYGQGITDKAEKFRNNLINMSWTEKPLWFHKDLRTILTMSNNEVYIKPYGLFVLNLRNFSVIMNAAYSYYNVLNTLSE